MEKENLDHSHNDETGKDRNSETKVTGGVIKGIRGLFKTVILGVAMSGVVEEAIANNDNDSDEVNRGQIVMTKGDVSTSNSTYVLYSGDGLEGGVGPDPDDDFDEDLSFNEVKGEIQANTTRAEELIESRRALYKNVKIGAELPDLEKYTDSINSEYSNKNKAKYEKYINDVIQKSNFHGEIDKINDTEELQDYINNLNISWLLSTMDMIDLSVNEKEAKYYVFEVFKNISLMMADMAGEDEYDKQDALKNIKKTISDEFNKMIERLYSTEVIIDKDLPLYTDSEGNMRLIFEFFNKSGEKAIEDYRAKNDTSLLVSNPSFGHDYEGQYSWVVVDISKDGKSFQVRDGSKHILPDIDNLNSVRMGPMFGFNKVEDKSVADIIEENRKLELTQTPETVEEGVKEEIVKSDLGVEETAEEKSKYITSISSENTYFDKMFGLSKEERKINEEKLVDYISDQFSLDSLFFEDSYYNPNVFKDLSKIENSTEYLKLLVNEKFDFSNRSAENYGSDLGLVTSLRFAMPEITELFHLMNEMGQEDVMNKMESLMLDWNMKIVPDENVLPFYINLIKGWDKYEENKPFLDSIGFDVARYYGDGSSFAYNLTPVSKLLTTTGLEKKIENLEKILDYDLLVRSPDTEESFSLSYKIKNGGGNMLNDKFHEDLILENIELLNIDFNNDNFIKVLKDKYNIDLDTELETHIDIDELERLYQFASSSYFESYESYVDTLIQDFPSIKIKIYSSQELYYDLKYWKEYDQDNIRRFLESFPDEDISISNVMNISMFYTEKLENYINKLEDIQVPQDMSGWSEITLKYNAKNKFNVELSNTLDVNYYDALIDKIERDSTYITEDEDIRPIIEFFNTSEMKDLEKRVIEISKDQNKWMPETGLGLAIYKSSSIQDIYEQIDKIKERIDKFEKVYEIMNEGEFGYKKLKDDLSGAFTDNLLFGDAENISMPPSLLMSDEFEIDNILDKKNYNRTVILLKKLMKTNPNSYSLISFKDFAHILNNIDFFESFVSDLDDIFDYNIDMTQLTKDNIVTLSDNLDNNEIRDRLIKLKNVDFVVTKTYLADHNGLAKILLEDGFWEMMNDSKFQNYVKSIIDMNVRVDTKDAYIDVESLNTWHLNYLMNSYKNPNLKQKILNTGNILKKVKSGLDEVDPLRRDIEDGTFNSRLVNDLSTVEEQNPVDLFMMNSLQEFLKDQDNLDKIGRMLMTDYNDTRTEYGGGIKISNLGQLELELDGAVELSEDGAHIPSKGFRERDDFVCSFHFHAVQPAPDDKYKDVSKFAGPSGQNILGGGGDLAVVKEHARNDVVITLLPDNNFNIKFYGPTGKSWKVFDLGVHNFTPVVDEDIQFIEGTEVDSK